MRLIRKAILPILFLFTFTTTFALKARIAFVKGRVLVIHNYKVQRGKVGMAVPKGATVQTAYRSRAILQLSNGTRISLKPNTTAKLNRLGPNTKQYGTETEVGLSHGKVSAFVKKSKYPYHKNAFRVRTPTAVAGVRGSYASYSRLRALTIKSIQSAGYYSKRVDDYRESARQGEAKLNTLLLKRMVELKQAKDSARQGLDTQALSQEVAELKESTQSEFTASQELINAREEVLRKQRAAANAASSAKYNRERLQQLIKRAEITRSNLSNLKDAGSAAIKEFNSKLKELGELKEQAKDITPKKEQLSAANDKLTAANDKLNRAKQYLANAPTWLKEMKVKAGIFARARTYSFRRRRYTRLRASDLERLGLYNSASFRRLNISRGRNGYFNMPAATASFFSNRLSANINTLRANIQNGPQTLELISNEVKEAQASFEAIGGDKALEQTTKELESLQSRIATNESGQRARLLNVYSSHRSVIKQSVGLRDHERALSTGQGRSLNYVLRAFERSQAAERQAEIEMRQATIKANYRELIERRQYAAALEAVTQESSSTAANNAGEQVEAPEGSAASIGPDKTVTPEQRADSESTIVEVKADAATEGEAQTQAENSDSPVGTGNDFQNLQNDVNEVTQPAESGSTVVPIQKF